MKKTRKITKLLLTALAVCLLFAFASCQFIGGSLELKSFTVDRSTVKTVYVVGDSIDFSGIKATAVYSDESLNKVYTFEELTITYPEDITATPGQKTVKVSFLDPNLNVTQETTVQITVNEDPFAVKHVSYRVDASAVKTSYNLGETIDFDGIKLYEKFSDGSEVEITDLAALSYSPALDGLTATAGNKSVKVQYNGEDAGAITVKVIDPEEEKNHVVSVVLGGEYKTTYELGEAIDLTGVTVTVTYEDGEVRTLTHESLTAETVDMSTTGTKTVVISFHDPINNEEDFESINITVVKKDVVAQFEKPAGITAFESDNKSAGTLNYGDAGFQGQFINGGKTYTVGDDNPFNFVPQFAIEEDGIPKTLTAFYSNVNLYILVNGEYVLLNKTADATNPALFTYTTEAGDVIASVDTYRGSYQFGEAAKAYRVKISVLPSEEHYKLGNTSEVTLEVNVIDAYNVYEAWQLAVIDTNTDRDDWNEIKTANGILGYAPAGIVLHNDIKLTYADVPSTFFNVSTADVVYTKDVNGVISTSVAPKGTRYLIDGIDVYRRTSTTDFVMEGNFFTIDTKEFPLIASPAVFDKNLDLDYGSDYSNSTLIIFEGVSENWVQVTSPNISVNNIAFIGNAARDNWVDAEGELVTAGGLILIKSSRCAVTTFNNTNNNSFFISYFPDCGGHLNVNDSKCYDTYQNGAFVWSNCEFNVTNTYINGTGGPAIIAMSVKETVDGAETYLNPVINIDDKSVIETHTTGEEIWYKSINATSIVGDIKALGAGLDQLLQAASNGAAKGNWVDANGKMNIEAILMPRGSDTSALTDAMIQGTVDIDETVIDRWYTSEYWNPILTNFYFQNGAPVLTAYDAAGNAYTIIYTGMEGAQAFCDINGNFIGTDPSHTAIIMAFATAEEVVLHQGGLSAILEFYH